MNITNFSSFMIVHFGFDLLVQEYLWEIYKERKRREEGEEISLIKDF